MLEDMVPLLRLAAQSSSQTDTPLPLSEAEWEKQQSHFATLTSLLQTNPGQVFSLDNPQPGFPVLSVPLLASLFRLISKTKLDNTYVEQLRMPQ